MSMINDLISELCPNGVPYVPISELGTLTRGKRFVHADSVDEGIPCIHYGELYTYYGISTVSTKSHVRSDLADKLRYAKKNDVIIVGAGENDIDIGIAVAYLGDEKVAIHDACYTFTQNNDPKYISYCLRTDDYHNQIKKYVSTGKICAISAEGIGKARIPIPPMPVQQEIVRILDDYTKLTAELSKELNSELSYRRSQYEYYRNRILEFDSSFPEMTIGEIANVTIGEFIHRNKQNPEAEYPVYNGGISYTGFYDDFNREGNKIIISARGANAGYVNRVFTRYWSGNSCYTVDVNSEIADWNYVYYWLKANEQKLIGDQQKGGIPAVSKKQVENFKIIIPPINEQKKLIETLERFDQLFNDITDSLTNEIESRQKQYGYYRDQLLAFKEA